LRGPDLVRTFVEAFNEGDLDALVETLSEDVEIQSSRGLVEGREEARRWATRNPKGELRQRLLIDAIAEHGAHAVADLRRQWYWRENGEVGDEQPVYYVATLRDGLICRWQPFAKRDDALRAAGVDPDAT
jgi:ketosteroid isomerase-like protein